MRRRNSDCHQRIRRARHFDPLSNCILQTSLIAHSVISWKEYQDRIGALTRGQRSSRSQADTCCRVTGLRLYNDPRKGNMLAD
jgi:hypothetical protein